MSALRYMLMIASFAGALLSLAIARYEGGLDEAAILLLLAIGALCTVNFFYLVSHGPPTEFWPLRMFRLWREAKEDELRRRVTHPGSGT